MTELHGILALVRRTRRRLRWQLALEWATTALIPALAGALVVLWLGRMGWVGATGAWVALAALGLAVLAAAAIGATRRLPTPLVAARLDRASGLASRLGTACDFAERLARGAPDHPDTVALMRAAIADAARAAPRADVRSAAPFRAPRDLRALGAFAGVAAAIALLSFGPEPTGSAPALVASAGPATPGFELDKEALDPDDLEFQREFIADMEEIARQTGDPHLAEFAKNLRELLDQAEKGELSKQELLARMDTLEKEYTKGADADLDATLAELKEHGKQLKKNRVTAKLGEALEAGDVAAAQRELEKLADQVEKGELEPKEQEKLAEALEKVAEQHERKRKKDEQELAELDQKITKKKDELRRLERRAEKEPAQREKLKRTLDRKKRELERLERNKQDRQAELRKRRLDRLMRNMRKSAESLKNKNEREESASNMRKAADETRKVADDIRKVTNQRRVQSKLADLKEAIRRAKTRKGQGRGKGMARMRRIQEWQRRAAGGSGNPSQWRPGQPGQDGKEGQLGGKQGGGKQGKQWGDQHDPNVQGDPTRLAGAKTKDEDLQGVHGQGPSRREVILTSAKKGFATTAYKRVYADYKKIVEEVMSEEKVPQGYKYYVKRYFQRIKPHSMD